MWATVIKTLLLSGLLSPASAAPLAGQDRQLKVVSSTVTEHGYTIDWVVKESQGEIAEAPKNPPPSAGKPNKAFQDFVANLPKGPDGTVPILRTTGASVPGIKKGPPRSAEQQKRHAAEVQSRADYAGTHWYALASQSVDAHGAIGTFSLFKPFVANQGDFSLLQTAVAYGSAQHAGTGNVQQTVEAGWINSPQQNSAPHLFTYFTTNGYAAEGDNIGGWNLDHRGFVQTDTSMYPGMPFTPLSVDGGAQHDLAIGYILSGGNWWLWVNNAYIGYYPASVFSQGGVDASKTLATKADSIGFYGEIYNSLSPMTTTDMGSGEFPNAGQGKAAYIRNIEYYDTAGNAQNYSPNTNGLVSDASRYNIQTSWNSGTSWGSFCYLGGPGAGGRIGA